MNPVYVPSTILMLLASFFATSALSAGKNPIDWQLQNPIQNPSYVGRSYQITYTFTNQLPFTLPRALVVRHTATPSNAFSVQNNCLNLALLPNQRCTYIISYIPKTPGINSIQVQFGGFDHNTIMLPPLTSIAEGVGTNGLTAVVSQSLPANLPQSSLANYRFRFTNNGNGTFSNVMTSSNQTEATSTCPSSLIVGQSCVVQGTFSSVNVGVQKVTATIRYTPNGQKSQQQTLTTETSVTRASGVIGSVVPPNLLPPIMLGGAPKPVQYLFTNHTGKTINLSGYTVTTSGLNASFNVDTDPAKTNCNAATLPNNAACQITGSFTAPKSASPMNYSATATLDYADAMGPEQSTVTTQTYVVPSLTENRNITFQNNCPFKVWFSLNGSALNNSPSCTKDTDCPSGTRCNTSTSSCYWKNYASPNDTYLLSANGGSNSVTIPLHPNTDPNIQWSGNFSASTLCISGQNCGQAECGNQGGDAPCAPGVGFKQPATQAEITMNRNTGDSYDLEVINGFHIPIAMKPIYYPSIDAIPDNYNCGTPGEFKEVNGFGGCDWRSASPNGNGYYWVTNSGNTCNITAPSCAGGTVCGLNESFQQVCGNFLGYWTANEVCGKSNVPASVRAFFHCDIALPAGYPQNSTIYDLMACAVPTGDTNPTFNSCYLNYSGFSRSKISQCCGCSDWWTEGVAANPHTQSCTPAGQTSAQSSPEWKQYVFPGLVWIKKACPSSYTYPFDDKTSGFGCTNNAQNAPNSTGYTLTFCPGNSGLPHGINEGRQ